jgi:MFS family permease
MSAIGVEEAPSRARDFRLRRLLILASVMASLDTTYFTVLTPLLPHFREQADLDQAQAGALSASYALGSLVAAIPSGVLAVRVGPRAVVLWGLALLASSSMVFGWGRDVTVLTAGRLIQGASGAILFTGALTWLINAVPQNEKGKVLGTAMAAGIFGALVGPPLGALGAVVGPKELFTAAVLIPPLLALAAVTIPDAKIDEQVPPVLPVLRTPPFRNGLLLLIAPSLCFGVLAVLAPLRLDALGASAGLIALAFFLPALAEGSLAPVAGARSDAIGRRRPYLAGLLISAWAVVGIAFISSVPLLLTALIVCSVGGGLAVTPALAHISDSATAMAIPQAFAVAFSNLGWSAGTAAGGLTGGTLAQLGGFQLPLIFAGVLLTLTCIRAWPKRVFVKAPAIVPLRPVAEE